MEEIEIIEENKLIAEFMGAEKSHFGDYIVYPLNVDANAFGKTEYSDLKYHSSWNWLMPVVEKIGLLKYPFYIYTSHIQKSACIYDLKNGYTIVKESGVKTSLIEYTYKAVVEFIKGYKPNTP